MRELLEGLVDAGESARAVVIGPASDAPKQVTLAGTSDAHLLTRLVSFAAETRRASNTADVIDSHFALYALLPLVFGRFRGKPLVVHFHGPWADETIAAGERRAIVVWAKRRLERIVYRRAEAAVTLSHAFMRILVERYRVSPWRIHVIAPGVNLSLFSPGDRLAARAVLGIPPDCWVACSVRRLVRRTGVETLLQAWAALDSATPRLLVIAGDGPERQRLERVAEEFGIADSVRFLGLVSEDELVALYRAADVSVVPSLSLEGFGLVVLESLACATPVIATDVGGLPSVLAGLEPRSIVPPARPDALADRLVGPLPNPASCRATAEGFNWPSCVERHRALYASLRASGSAPARIRIVYVDHTAKLSGAELALLRLLPALENVQPHVILGEDGPLVSRLLEAGISVEVLEIGNDTGNLRRERVGWATVGSRHGVATAWYVVRLAARLRQLRPDLVHTNSLKSAVYGGLAGKLVAVPIVSHVHDRITDDYLPPAATRFMRTTLQRLPHSVIAPSRTVSETLGGDAHVIPWPAPLPQEPADADSRPFTVGMVGRIAPWKGQHVFVKAFNKAFPDGEERAVVVGAPMFGSAEERYLDEVRALGNSLGERLRFTGFVDDVGAELARMDVLVHASVIPEPFGQVILEGMASGLAVVAPAAGGPAELIDDGVDGRLYPAGDSAALAELLSELALNQDLRNRLGSAGRQRASEVTPSRIALRIAAVYEEVLRARRSRTSHRSPAEIDSRARR